MSDSVFSIKPKSAIEIAHEWLVVRGWKYPIPRGGFNAMQTDSGACFDMAVELAEFAGLYAQQLGFERNAYKKIAEDALACSLPPTILIDRDLAGIKTATGSTIYEDGKRAIHRQVLRYERALAIVKKLSEEGDNATDDEGQVCLLCSGAMDNALPNRTQGHAADCPYRLAVELIEERKG